MRRGSACLVGNNVFFENRDRSAGVALVPTFVRARAARGYERRNRDTWLPRRASAGRAASIAGSDSLSFSEILRLPVARRSVPVCELSHRRTRLRMASSHPSPGAAPTGSGRQNEGTTANAATRTAIFGPGDRRGHASAEPQSGLRADGGRPLHARAGVAFVHAGHHAGAAKSGGIQSQCDRRRGRPVARLSLRSWIVGRRIHRRRSGPWRAVAAYETAFTTNRLTSQGCKR
jgi:hypothetical protein